MCPLMCSGRLGETVGICSKQSFYTFRLLVLSLVQKRYRASVVQYEQVTTLVDGDTQAFHKFCSTLGVTEWSALVSRRPPLHIIVNRLPATTLVRFASPVPTSDNTHVAEASVAVSDVAMMSGLLAAQSRWSLERVRVLILAQV